LNSPIHNRHRLAFALSMLVWLCGCGTSIDPANMAVRPTITEGDFPNVLHDAMCARNVTGREDTNEFWGSVVSNQEFSDALDASLHAAGLGASAGACKYPIDVHMLGVIQYNHAFSMDVTSHANYKVYGADGQPILLETISAAGYSDASFGPMRIKRANEASVRASFSQFLEKLRAVKLP
jgi:hypothetical protein